MKVLSPCQTNLPEAILNLHFRKLYFTAPHTGTGTTTCILAISKTLSAFCAHKIVLIDGNPSPSSLTHQLGLQKNPGFSDILSSADLDIENLVHPIENDKIHIIPAGDHDKMKSCNTNLRRVADEFLTKLEKVYDYILYDAPPIYSKNNSLALASIFHGAVLIINSNDTRQEVAGSAKERLSLADVKLIGAIFNRRRYHIPNWLYNFL